MVADEAISEIFLPGAERHVGDAFACGGDRRRFRDIDGFRGAKSDGRKRVGPVELGRQLLELRHGHHIMGGDGVAAPFGGPLVLGEPRLKRDDPVGATFRVRQARELSQLDDVSAISGADGIVFLALEQIIVARWQPQASLTGMDGVSGRVILVGGDPHVDRSGVTRLRHQLHQRVAILHRVDLRQIGLERI